jgi:hypothetical protein
MVALKAPLPLSLGRGCGVINPHRALHVIYLHILELMFSNIHGDWRCNHNIFEKIRSIMQ